MTVLWQFLCLHIDGFHQSDNTNVFDIFHVHMIEFFSIINPASTVLIFDCIRKIKCNLPLKTIPWLIGYWRKITRVFWWFHFHFIYCISSVNVYWDLDLWFWTNFSVLEFGVKRKHYTNALWNSRLSVHFLVFVTSHFCSQWNESEKLRLLETNFLNQNKQILKFSRLICKITQVQWFEF